MSNLSKEQNYHSLEEAWGFLLHQFKLGLNTALPGIIKAYHATTKRAEVVPAILQTFTTGAPPKSLPVIFDVPVIFPSASGYTLTMPIQPGDSVLLVFSQRGLTHFKAKFTESLPTETALLSLPDAVAMVGFGALNITPASNSGCTLQDNAGHNAVVIEGDQVKVTKGNNKVTLDDNQLQATVAGATLTLTSSMLTSSVGISAPFFSGPQGAAATMKTGIDMSGQAIKNASDVVAGGISLKGHKHGNGNGSGDTTAPK